jgi:hypothetical protein
MVNRFRAFVKIVAFRGLYFKSNLPHNLTVYVKRAVLQLLSIYNWRNLCGYPHCSQVGWAATAQWYHDANRGHNSISSTVANAAKQLPIEYVRAHVSNVNPDGSVHLSNHSGRATSITIMLKAGMDTAAIQAVSSRAALCK